MGTPDLPRLTTKLRLATKPLAHAEQNIRSGEIVHRLNGPSMTANGFFQALAAEAAAENLQMLPASGLLRRWFRVFSRTGTLGHWLQATGIGHAETG